MDTEVSKFLLGLDWAAFYAGLFNAFVEGNHNAWPKVNELEYEKSNLGFETKTEDKEILNTQDSGSYDDLYHLEWKPDWKVKSSKIKSYSFERLMPNEDSNLVGVGDLEKPRQNQINLKVARKDETCFHTVKNEIANLFNDDFDISKSIFPLCCKGKTTKCMTTMKRITTCPQKTQKVTLKQLTSQFPTTCVHQSVSNEAVVNVVIHVKCDHPEVRDHVSPNTKPVELIPASNYSYSVHLINRKTTEITKYSSCKTQESLQQTQFAEKLLVQQCKDGIPSEIDQRTRHKDNNSAKNFDDKFPHPLLPHDITIQFTKPTHKPPATVLPVFICKITPKLCNFTSTTAKTKPKLTLWKKISLPRFWPATPPKITECLEIVRSTKDPFCENEETEKKPVATCSTPIKNAENLEKWEGLNNLNIEVPTSENPHSSFPEPYDSKLTVPMGPAKDFSLLSNEELAKLLTTETMQPDTEEVSVEPTIKTYKDTAHIQDSTEYEESASESYEPFSSSEQILIQAHTQPSEHHSSNVEVSLTNTEHMNISKETFTEPNQMLTTQGLQQHQGQSTEGSGSVGADATVEGGETPGDKNIITNPGELQLDRTVDSLVGVGTPTIDYISSQLLDILQYVSSPEPLENDNPSSLITEATHYEKNTLTTLALPEKVDTDDTFKHFENEISLSVSETHTIAEEDTTPLSSVERPPEDTHALSITESQLDHLPGDQQHTTTFTVDSTEFDDKGVELDVVTQNVRDLSEHTVEHVIDLGGGKFQFYWNGKWFITDQTHFWQFDSQTTALMNETFFSLPEDNTAKQISFHQLLVQSSYETNAEMPFELFAQSMLKSAKYSKDIYFQWGGYSLSYGDIIAMLRLSSFNTYTVSQESGDSWGQINWHIIYDKLKQSSTVSSTEKQAYEVVDFDGSTYPLIVFSNGTSIWKHSKLDLDESLVTLQSINKEIHFRDIIVVSTYISSAGSFQDFMRDAISDRLQNKVLHSYYVWKSYKFQWDDLEAINRMFLYQYESQSENGLSFSKIALPVLSSTKQVYPNRTVFQVSLGSEIKPLIVYSNGITEYDNVKLELEYTVSQVEKLKQSSTLTFKEDWENGVITLKEVQDNQIDGKEETHKYSWEQLNNNPYFNVCYPINLGGGKVQFYMKNTWFITDGLNIWPFENPLSNFYINEMVKAMHQTFTDDPKLDKATIQSLVDKTLSHGLEELLIPHELLLQHHLFFMNHLDQGIAYNISKDIIYQREKLHVSSTELLFALRLSAYNSFTTKEVELPWEKGKKLNWDWFFFMGKKTEREIIMDEPVDTLNTSYFDEYKNSPMLKLYSNFSTDWGDQRLELNEALLKVQHANEHCNFLPLEVNGELKPENDSFELLYKEALRKRFESNKTYSKYKWGSDSITWYDILIVVRFPETNPDVVVDNMFWKNAMKDISRAWKTKFSDRLEYVVSDMDPNSKTKDVVYMNETTIFKGKKMDFVEYKAFI